MKPVRKTNDRLSCDAIQQRFNLDGGYEEAKHLHAEITSGKSIREARQNKPERSPGRSVTPRRYRDDDDDGRGGNGRGKRFGP